MKCGLEVLPARVLHALAHRTVQTNDTSRAVTWLWPAALAGAREGGRPVALVDVGASAGLNLTADALPSPWVFEDGSAVPVARGIRAVVSDVKCGLEVLPATQAVTYIVQRFASLATLFYAASVVLYLRARPGLEIRSRGRRPIVTG